jgi:hypothetical protein
VGLGRSLTVDASWVWGAHSIGLAIGEAVGAGALVLGVAGHGVDASVLGAAGRGVGVDVVGHGLGVADAVGVGGRGLGILGRGMGTSSSASGKSRGDPLPAQLLVA